MPQHPRTPLVPTFVSVVAALVATAAVALTVAMASTLVPAAPTPAVARAAGPGAVAAPGPVPAPGPVVPGAAPDSVPLYDDLGELHHPVSTTSTRAQAYFDQGLRLQYAFNHDEAIRSYREALRHDPDCAMCWWGIALALGPNINAPMSPEAGERAREAIRRAVELAPEAGADDRAYIGALEEPMPDPELVNATALAHYARGVALAATGRGDEASAELEAVRRIAEEHSAHGAEASDPVVVVAIADHMLAGEIALRSGRAGEAVRHFEAAMELEDAMLYEEPPLWYYPVRHALGRALLEAGRPEEAERRYREDLAKYPENGWSLRGLTSALEAQGRDGEAREARARFDRAWREADVTLAASRY